MKTFFAMVCLLTPMSLQAFSLNSSSDSSFQGWVNPELTFNVNPANCPAGLDVAGLIDDAVKVWNNVPTSRVKISYGTTTSSTTFANPTTIYCETNFQGVTGADQNYVPAAASIQRSGHNATGGLLYLNASAGNANIGLYDRTMLLIIIAHEVGHILGLGHSQDVHALMYYNAGAKANLTLGQDDIDGVSYLYPRDELNGDKMMGCGLVASAGNAKPPGAGPLAVLALLMLLPVAVYVRLRFHQFS
jgi:hypothetical protein